MEKPEIPMRNVKNRCENVSMTTCNDYGILTQMIREIKLPEIVLSTKECQIKFAAKIGWVTCTLYILLFKKLSRN